MAYLRKLIETSKVKSFGVSNISMGFKEIVDHFNANGLKVEAIENHVNNNTLHFSPTKDILSYAQKNNINFIGYGTLGGIVGEGPCQAFCEVRQPVIHFDAVTHPVVTALGAQYKVDPMMLLLAYEAKKFVIYQIPTTTNKERLEANFTSFKRAYDALTEEDLNAITEEIGLAEPSEFKNLPNNLRNTIRYRSRLRLIQHLQENQSELIKTINSAESIFAARDDGKKDVLINKLLYIYEQARKFNKDIDLEKLLSQLNKFFIPEKTKHRFTPISTDLLSLDANQYRTLLVDSFIEKLTSNIRFLKLLENNYFTVNDFSNPRTSWPAVRKVMILNPLDKKIVQFDIAAQTFDSVVIRNNPASLPHTNNSGF